MAAEEQLRALQAQLAELQGMVATLTQQQQQQPAAPAAAAAAAAPSQLPPAIDTRVIGKPEMFFGSREKFPEWSFVFKAYMSAIDARYSDLLEQAGDKDSIIRNLDLEPHEKQLSTQLYYILVMLCRDKAQDKMNAVGSGEGFEAWRQFIIDWDPKVRTRRVGMMIKILTAKFGGDIPQSLDQFETMIREYEQQSKKVFDEDLKLGLVVVNMTDAGVQKHLVKNANRLDTWKAMKDELLDMARTEQYLNSQARPMELGGLPRPEAKEGKGKGDQKGKGTGEGTGK